MKTVLCFGDSNTWGYDPDASAASPFPLRHPPEVRWTGVLARELGADWRVIEEGQNGRTTVFEDPLTPHRVGRDYLPAALESHKPLDVVVLMLGTNDLKVFNSAPASQIAEGAGVLAKIILGSDAGPRARPPKLLLVAPAAVGTFAHLPDLEEKFAGAEVKARRFPELFGRLAEALGCGFLNAREYAQPSPTDGLHFDALSHRALGRAIAATVVKLRD
jgi:lysophospholipase L1-like esterase